MNNLLGIGQLFLTQSFYSSSDLEKQVRKFNITEKKLYETSCDPIVPRVREGGRRGRERERDKGKEEESEEGEYILALSSFFHLVYIVDVFPINISKSTSH